MRFGVAGELSAESDKLCRHFFGKQKRWDLEIEIIASSRPILK